MDNQGLDDKDTFILDAAIWQTIVREIDNSHMMELTQLCNRPSRDINTMHNTFKAAEWSSWLLYHSILQLQGRLPDSYMNNCKDLVKISVFICSEHITKYQIKECQKLCIPCVINYNGLHFYSRREGLKLLMSNLHAIVHIADTLTHLGRGPEWWCFAAKRFHSTLQGTVNSKVQI